jgi:transcriptional regulator of acetoin/glycerol metabolism
LEGSAPLLRGGFPTFQAGDRESSSDLDARRPTATTLATAEREHILRVCEACRWRINGPGAAAERLGLNPSTLYFRMKKLGIKRASLPS